MKISGGFSGALQFKKSVLAMDKSSKDALFKTITQLAYRISSTAKKSIQGGKKSGRTYARGSKTHTASKAGEAPASDTGNLANSILVQYNKAKVEASVVANTPYAAALEYGSRGSPERNIPPLQPRPFMRPAFFLQTGQGSTADLLRINWSAIK